MKSFIKIFLVCFVLVIGCSSPSVRHTIYEQQMYQKQQKLTEDAKEFIVKATDMLDSGTMDTKRIKMLLEKSQSLLNVDVDDGKTLENLNGEELDQAVDKIFEDSQKEKRAIADLKIKDEQEISKIITNNIESETIKKYERAKTIKFYAICATILTILGALVYFFPTKALDVGSSIIGFFFKK
jgi:hypothetical protein